MADWARVEVSGTGTGEWHPQPGHARDDEEYGRGLTLHGAQAPLFMKISLAWP